MAHMNVSEVQEIEATAHIFCLNRVSCALNKLSAPHTSQTV